MSATTLNNTTSNKQTISRSIPTIWQGLVGLLAIVAIVSIVMYFISAVNFRNRPFIGAMVTNTLTINAGQATGNAEWSGLAAGLLRNDQIIAINGQELFDTEGDYAGAQARFTSILDNLARSGDLAPIVLTVLRQDATQSYCTDGVCTLSLNPSQTLPDVDFLAYFLMPFIGALAVLGLGLLILRYKFDTQEGIIAAAIAFGVAIFTAGLFDVGTQARLTPVWVIATCMASVSMVIFGLTFPKPLKIVRDYPALPYALLGLGVGLAALIIYQLSNLTTALSGVATWIPFTLMITAVGVLCIWGATILQRNNARTPSNRDQANTVFIGTSLMLIPVLIWLVGRNFTLQNGAPIIPFNLEAMITLNIFPIVAITYAVMQYRRVDTEKVISEGITYGIMAGALSLSMFMLVLGASLLSIDLFNASNNAILIALILFAMVILFVPIRNRLQDRIDAIYYRQQRDFQTKVQTFNRNLAGMNDYNQIIELFCESVTETLMPSHFHIFLRERANGDFVAHKMNGKGTDVRFTNDSPMIPLLQEEENNLVNVGQDVKWHPALRLDQARLKLLKSQVIVGLQGTEQLNGFIILGQPTNKSKYSYEELRYLTDVNSQLAISTERSQVVDTLQRRVQELDVLSQVGQAVNFTIELDDLLELIYAQTSKLLPIPNFYIVLYEENINRLYFAFFLEDDERYEDKENVRWVVGQDLFSEVVNKNTALSVKDFSGEMKRRGADLPFLQDGLLSWIGVPLIAGRNILGVMATGKRRDTAEYTDEQFKIFSDVAALAATSLDKANLFNQTLLRERQLTVLNDISRQLVATETDVEKLLQIIMTSAVEILNAEAGSLLLNAEDDSGDLEFRVVIGGSGDDLMGTRVEQGKGIVGEVVQTSSHVIVNDTETATIKNVKVTDDFISRSLLAVPLIAQDTVIGVLEVINKKDGTPFVTEDASLLTTFAGQAAVAIENARLFQQTDQQLSLRLRELETLEKMDAELNRTLDLNEVAEITVRQAMNILAADAGALGIVHQTPPFLEIVAIKGYDRDEYPVEASGDDGLTWPLDAGIVKRVMRSRQADITMDVSLDPDYDIGLKNSNSQITLPMMAGDEINAILILEKNSLPRFSLPDWAFAQRIAEHASIAIANAQFAFSLNNAMKSKSEFMGFAAHELKNPLSSIKGYADVMLTGMTGEMSEQQQGFVNIIKSNAVRMQTIIDDLRDSAKIDSKEFRVEAEPMNVRTAVVETLRPFVKMLEDKNQELVNNVPEDLPLIWGDETRVIQVLTNLVSNAHKYSRNETTITVSGELREDHIDQQGYKMGRMVVLSVTDEGIGMSEEDQKRLFKESYFRSTNAEAQNMAAGTGLGMMLTYNIMVQHKGDIWIESELGKGSTFHIAFPLADDMETQIKAAGD